MPSAASWEGDLNEQADRIERTLEGMAMPVRVNGAELSESSVRYWVTPLSATTARDLQNAVARLARAIGAPEIRLERQTSGIALEMPLAQRMQTRLWPVLQATGRLPRLGAIWGLRGDGSPFQASLIQPGSWHAAVSGGDESLRADWLRGLVLGLALSAPPARLQLLGIDFSGRQLNIIEALPHLLRPLALLPCQANALLGELESELDRRAQNAVRWPHIVLAIADLADTVRLPAVGRDPALLARLMQLGQGSGLHVVFACEGFPQLDRLAVMHQAAHAVLIPSQNADTLHMLKLTIGLASHRLTFLHLGVVDMDLLMRRFIYRCKAGKDRLAYSAGRPLAGW
jgi:DNA segregation ATPase FtsK/SpoIIIE-like protein